MSIEAMKHVRDVMLHDGVPVDKAHPKRVALDELEVAIEQAEQAQPVAYMLLCFSKGQTKPNSKTLFFPEQYTGRTDPVSVGAWGEERVVPLYTSPPRGKPLTHPQIHELDWPDGVAFEEILLFARAIEAAHGIKGEA